VPEEPITERTTLPPSSPFIDALIRSERIAPAPAPTWESQTRKLGPWAIGAAVLFVFLLGRWSAPSPELQPAAREVTSSSAHASVRGSAVLRREGATTDARSPRPPR
jgi:hypothetical protein